jgi:hypothetical protein
MQNQQASGVQVSGLCMTRQKAVECVGKRYGIIVYTEATNVRIEISRGNTYRKCVACQWSVKNPKIAA